MVPIVRRSRCGSLAVRPRPSHCRSVPCGFSLRCDHFLKERGPVQHLDAIVELDIGELRDAIDCQEHAQLAVSHAQLAVIYMDGTDRPGERALF